MDIALSVLLCLLLAPVFILVALVILIADGSPCLFISTRVGKNGNTFRMYKFRTLKLETPLVETDLLQNGSDLYIKYGKVIRAFSIDELPQLFNVLQGDMSLVGYRPALPSQSVLNQLRERRGIHRKFPGITGLAQINGRDALEIRRKVAFDCLQDRNYSLCYYLYTLASTLRPVFNRFGVKH